VSILFFKFFRSICAPTQERILCDKTSADLLAEYKQTKKKPYLYNEHNHIGGNPISDITKKLAHELCFEDWEKCTRQGLCKWELPTQ